MTEATAKRPVKRKVVTERGDELVVELEGNVLRLRPKGARRGGPAEVMVEVGVLYTRALGQAIGFDTRPTKRRRR